jgi:hypothetical protein
MEPRDRERRVEEFVDSALKQYGEAEPLPGLEGRVLANLRVPGKELAERRNWWLALGAAGVAIVVVVVGATTFLTRERSAGPQVVAAQPATSALAKEAVKSAVPSKPKDIFGSASVFARRARRSMRSLATTGEDGPKLEQFPSPRPLSAQEELLARYVRERPREAGLVARAQAELLKRDLLEFEKQHDSHELASDSTQ